MATRGAIIKSRTASLDNKIRSGVEMSAKSPNFEAIKDKRMGELNHEQLEDAHELWIKENQGYMIGDCRDHVAFLLKRLEEARK